MGKYFTFSFKGRLRRLDYFLGLLINGLVYCIPYGLFLFDGNSGSENVFVQVISFVCMAILWIMQLSIMVRRSHDIGKSGWFILIPFYTIVLYFVKGDVGENEYGADPKNPNIKVV